MRKWIVLAMAALVCTGCASVPRTTTYQTMEWREVEESTPSATRVVQADIPQVFPGAKKGRKYLNIGYNPVNPNRVLTAGEVEFILPADAYVTTIDRNNKRSSGWLLAGERVIGTPTTNPDFYKAIWIRRCGNPILNEDRLAIFIRVRQEVAASRPTKRWVQEQVTHTRELSCRERKSGWGSVIGGVLGVGAGILTRNKTIAVATGASGTLLGSWIDGGCIEPGEAAQAIGFGALGYGLTKERVRHYQPPSRSGGPAPPPPNGPSGPAPLPSNGPAPLPANGPAYFNGGGPIMPNGPSFFPVN